MFNEVNKTTGSTRDIPVIIPRLTELVKKADADKYLVEWDEGKMRRELRKVCRENNLPILSMHCLRHTFASLCYHLQIPELEAAKLGGWSDLQTMHKIYTHLAEVDKTEAARKLRAFFAS